MSVQPKGDFRWERLLQVFGVIFAAYVILQQCEALLLDAQLVPDAGTIGATQADLQPTAEFAPGFVMVRGVTPNSPLERAGVRVGDHLQFRPTWNYLRSLKAGETIRMTWDHAGSRHELVLVTVPRDAFRSNPHAAWRAAIFDFSNLMPALFGAFVLWRSRARRVPMLLGMSLVVFGLGVVTPETWQAWPSTFLLLTGLHLATIVSVNILLVAFALWFAAESFGGTRRWQRMAFLLYVISNLVTWAIWLNCASRVVVLPVLGDGTELLQILGYIGFAASLALLYLGWRRANPQERQRFTLMLIGVSAIVASQIIALAVFAGSGQWFDTTHPLLVIAALLSGVVAPATLTYAILRHRVFDLGFALNRSLIFTAVSALLLMAFGIAEWAINHLVTIDGRESSALVDAAVALGIFLTFHRVRDFVKPRIERLFFHAWHDNEARIRRFIEEAAFILAPEALTSAFLAELDRFSGNAGAAIYQRGEAGRYSLTKASLSNAPSAIDPDDPVIVRLRMRQSVVDVRETQSTLHAKLALPMLFRSDILGFVLLGTKANGLDYRPDERELLALAARRVGADLHDLEVEDLQQRVRNLKVRNEELHAVLASHAPEGTLP